jgi:pimeloyl-ACP methyl ester carboxylesterase
VVAAGCGTGGRTQGAASPTTAAAHHHSRPGLTWRSCMGSVGGEQVQCATLQVPLDYAHPGGPTIGLALDRLPATGHRIGSLLVNPGGPGASGLQFMPQIAPLLTAGLRQHFDIIGFDPRGVGASDPVVCGTGPQIDRFLSVDADPVTPAGVNALVAADRAFAAGCRSHSGALLPHVGTVDAARDMDRIRQAVGDPKLNYLGFSYGTFLGATYADEYPTHIRAMVLDGAEDPSLGPIATVDTQAAAVDAELRSFFNWCASNPGSCSWHPAGGRSAMEGAVLSLISASRAHPLSVSGTRRQVGPSQVLYGMAEALYEPQTWAQLGQALGQASSGDGSGLLNLSDQYFERNSNGTYSNLVDANNAIDCEDAPWPSVSQVEAAVGTARSMAPVFGEPNLYSGLLCSVWPYPASDHPHRITAPGSPPIVVVGSTGDPATPYAWAQALASQLSRGVLLTRVGEGHTGYISSQCVRDAVGAYLVDLKAPAPGTVCQSDNPG